MINKGSLVKVKRIVEEEDDVNLHKYIGRYAKVINVIGDAYDIKFLYNNEKFTFYKEEIELISSDKTNEGRVKCFICKSKLRKTKFNKFTFTYCPKCLI